jgi:hypothetical protein
MLRVIHGLNHLRDAGERWVHDKQIDLQLQLSDERNRLQGIESWYACTPSFGHYIPQPKYKT